MIREDENDDKMLQSACDGTIGYMDKIPLLCESYDRSYSQEL